MRGECKANRDERSSQLAGVARIRARRRGCCHRLDRPVLAALQLRLARAADQRRLAYAGLGVAAAGGHLPGVRALPRTLAFREPSRSAAHRARRRTGSRFAYRVWKEHRLYSPLAALGEPVLILGAGEAGARLTKEFAHSREWRIVGLLDDDPAKQGRLLRNISVLGPIGELPMWTKRFGVHTVILALPSAAHAVRRRVAELCAAAGVEALTVPSYDDLMNGRSQLTTIRHVELDDLLGRDPVVLDSNGLREWLGGRVVMVTGAGGSIGAELCRQIARFRPARLVLFDISESALYQVQQALLDATPKLSLATVVGDVKHLLHVEQVLAREQQSSRRVILSWPTAASG